MLLHVHVCVCFISLLNHVSDGVVVFCRPVTCHNVMASINKLSLSCIPTECVPTECLSD